jgi:hypothetical protein
MEIFNRTIPAGPTPDQALRRSALGTPVYSDITFEAGSYEDDQGQIQTFEQIRLDAVLMSVGQTKKIVETEIQGRPGTVKEYIGDGDYEISLSGILTGSHLRHPREEVAALKRMLTARVPIAVSSPYLQNLGVTDVVVRSYFFAQNEGGYAYQAFTIEMVSDTPVELKINE